MELTELLRSHEGKTLEFKRDASSLEPMLRTVAAFANTAGGTFLIGVEDTTKEVRGVADPLALVERLTNVISDGIVPRVVPDIQMLPWRKTHVLAVQVYPSPSRPHCVASRGPERGVYVRVGSTNRVADPELIEEMKRFARGDAYDEQPIPDLSSEALDFRAASECFSSVRSLERRDLRTLHLATTHQGREVPTVGGLLLFGRAEVREGRFPDAWIQAGRFEGVDRTRILDHVQIRTHLPGAVEEAIQFVEKHSFHGARIGPVRREERWSLPPAAVREAVINAVAHADYAQHGAPIRVAMFDDRLEVENPGLLPLGLTVPDLLAGISKLRNRVIGRVFHELGLIEQWGSGIQRMTAACRDAGLAGPRLEELGTRFRVTLSLVKTESPRVGSADRIILDALDQARDAGLSTQEVAHIIERSARTARTRLARLVESGRVRVIGSGPQDPQRRYYSTR